MGKLHEVLAVEADLRATAQRTFQRLISLFSEGRSRLVGQSRKYQPLEESGEPHEDEITAMGTTVERELDLLQQDYSAWIDAAMQKEVTNQSTNADVVIGDRVLLEGLPATALLNLEGKLAELRRIYSSIPTYDPTERWEWDEQVEGYMSAPRITYRTKKVLKNHVKAEATKEHPAQVEVFTEDVREGTWTTVIQSGMLAPSEKREMLSRLDKLIRAVKQARQRANDVDAEDIHVGKVLFDFINGVA
jgi:hypothetical protein